VISVYSGVTGKPVGTVRTPAIFQASIRLDVVQHVHRDIAKNHRQPYAVSAAAGHQTSAESWGTGRAVARIPRVAGGGTHRAGQGAYGNMCRGGRMFAPTKTYRRWHRRVNKNQRRFAIVSAVAASASSALVLARGHKIARIPEIPLVVSDDTITKLEKTKAAVALLKKLHAYTDIEKVKDSKKLRAGKGKMRNRRYTQRRGPLVIYNKKTPMLRAFRNIPGIELLDVHHLNLLLLAPGGHLGRFIIWTQSAINMLDKLYGTFQKRAVLKANYSLPSSKLTNSDIARIINSDEVQSKLRDPKSRPKRVLRKKNPLKNSGVMIKLNPYAAVLRRAVIKAQERTRNRKKIASLKKAGKPLPKSKRPPKKDEKKDKKGPQPPKDPKAVAKRINLRKKTIYKNFVKPLLLA